MQGAGQTTQGAGQLPGASQAMLELLKEIAMEAPNAKTLMKMGTVGAVVAALVAFSWAGVTQPSMDPQHWPTLCKQVCEQIGTAAGVGCQPFQAVTAISLFGIGVYLQGADVEIVAPLPFLGAGLYLFLKLF
jgi:hypothetical protein